MLRKCELRLFISDFWFHRLQYMCKHLLRRNTKSMKRTLKLVILASFCFGYVGSQICKTLLRRNNKSIVLHSRYKPAILQFIHSQMQYTQAQCPVPRFTALDRSKIERMVTNKSTDNQPHRTENKYGC